MLKDMLNDKDIVVEALNGWEFSNWNWFLKLKLIFLTLAIGNSYCF
jgi:hypothetical protein